MTIFKKRKNVGGKSPFEMTIQQLNSRTVIKETVYVVVAWSVPQMCGRSPNNPGTKHNTTATR